MKIAMLGTGIMGRGIVSNLKQADHTLEIYARNANKVKDLEDSKTRIVSSVEELSTGLDVVILCLTEDVIVEDAFHKAVTRRPKHIVDFGTTSPELTDKMHLIATENGIRFNDSPMTGSKNAAASGQIGFMFGGSDSDFESLKPIYDKTAKGVTRCGLVGSAQKAKIALNMVQAMLLQSYQEGLVLAKSFGISPDTMFEVLNKSAANSGLLEFKYPFMKAGNYETHFALKNMNKDMNHAVAMALAQNVRLPNAFATKGVYDSGMNSGLAEKDFCATFVINRKDD